MLLALYAGRLERYEHLRGTLSITAFCPLRRVLKHIRPMLEDMFEELF
jgi:hypothetical protein